MSTLHPTFAIGGIRGTRLWITQLLRRQGQVVRVMACDPAGAVAGALHQFGRVATTT